MQCIGPYQVLFSEIGENNVFDIKCHANNQVISEIVTKIVY